MTPSGPTTSRRPGSPLGLLAETGDTGTASWHSMAAVYELIGAELECELEAVAGLSVVDFTVLTAVGREHGPHLPFHQLVDAMALSGEETSRLVDGLERRGLLSQVLCSRGGGGTCIELTASGRQLRELARWVHDRTLDRVMVRVRHRPALARAVEALQQAGLLPLSAAG